MSEAKKEDKNRETKAGLMDKNGGGEAVEKNESKSQDASENTPKIGKDKAGTHNNEPLH